MKVLYLHQYFSFPFGSQPGRSYVFAAQLAAAGCNVTICTGFGLGSDSGIDTPFRLGVRSVRLGRIRVLQFNIGYSNSMNFGERYSSFIAYAVATLILGVARRWDLIISSSTPLTVVIPLIVCKIVRRVRCVFEVRDRWPEVPLAFGVISKGAARIGDWLERLAVKLAETVIVLAPRTAAGYRRLGCELEKVFLIPNGCDLSISIEREGGLSLERIKKDALKIIYFGTLGKANNLNFVLRVAKICRRQNSSISFFIIGEGKMKEELVRRVREEEISLMMFFDSVPRTRLRDVLRSSDLAVHCLENNWIFSEGASPNKIFEALAAGLPVISNCQGWIGRRLAEGGAGIVLPAGDPFSFAHHLLMVAADIEKRSQMSLAAVQFCATDASMQCLSIQFKGAIGRNWNVFNR